MIIIVLSIIRKFAKITINFYNGKINNININPELIETTVCFLLSLTGILLCQLEQNKLCRKNRSISTLRWQSFSRTHKNKLLRCCATEEFGFVETLQIFTKLSDLVSYVLRRAMLCLCRVRERGVRLFLQVRRSILPTRHARYRGCLRILRVRCRPLR